MSSRKFFALCLLILPCACADAPPPPVVELPRPASAPAPAAARIAVVATAMPKDLVLDGELAEWGALDEPPPPPPAKGKAPRPPLPPANGRVAVALAPDGVALAADLPDASGAWLALALDDDVSFPPIGFYQRGGGVMGFDCEVNPANGEPQTPEEKKSCQRIVAAHQTEAEAYTALFVSTLRVSAEGVAAWRGGKLVPIAGAKVVAKTSGGRLRLEARLPLAALPETGFAATGSVGLAATSALGAPAPPKLEDAAFAWRQLPGAVRFEPLGELRERVLEQYRRQMVSPHVSFSPGDATRVHVLGYHGMDRSRVVDESDVLFAEQRPFGNLRIGYGLGGSLVVLRGDAVVDVVQGPAGTPRMIERDGELHVLGYAEWYAEDVGLSGGAWSGLAITPKGEIREELVRPPPREPLMAKPVAELHDAKLETFGFTYHPLDAKRDAAKELVLVTYRWSKKTRTYEPTLRRNAPAPVPVKGKPEK